MDRVEARDLLLGYSRFINDETDLWEAIELAIVALQEPKTIIGIDIPYGSDKGIAAIFKGKDDKLILERIKELMSDWIPVSERLPDKDGEYLVCPSDDVLEDYSDFSDVMIMPYDEGCEAFGWWTDRFDNVSLGYIDSDFNKFDVIAWQPLPEPYKGGDTE